MRYGHYWGYDGFQIPYYLWIIGLLIAGALILGFISEIRRKNSPENKKIMDILNSRYAKSEIDGDQYYEIRMILEDELLEETAMMIIKERYANGELDSREFVKMRDNILHFKNKGVDTKYSEIKYAKGEITEMEYKQSILKST